MRYFKIIATLTILAAGIFAQSPMADFDGTPWNDVADDNPVISWREAAFGAGEMVILSATYDSDGELIENRIIPLVPVDDGYVPLDEIGFGNVNSSERKVWRGFDEYGSEGIAPLTSNPVVADDYSVTMTTIDACPNLNIRDGEVVRSVNLAYIDGGETYLVGHTEITMRQVFDYETRSLITGELLNDYYRTDLSAMLLCSHFALDSTGYLFISEEPQDWARATHGLYALNGQSSRKWIAFNRNLTGAAAIEEAHFANNKWHATVYASPRCAISAAIDDINGLDFGIDNSIWFGDAIFESSVPVASTEPYEYAVEATSQECDLSQYHYPRTKIRSFKDRNIGPLAKSILGLDPSTDDTDGDGITDYLEMLMFSDPTDPSTEDEGYNDFELYFEMGMYPPLTTRKPFPDEMIAPGPRVYPNDPNPSSTIRPIKKKRGSPMQLKFESLVYEDRIAEAEDVRDRFELQYVFVQYGEEAMVNFYNNRSMYTVMRRTEEWDTMLYGSTDSDGDGIPDGLEESGRLFGGENYLHYGIHYWEEDLRLQMAYILGTEIDGLNPRDYINDSLWDDLGIVFIGTCAETTLGQPGFDTDIDGLDDYAEYLWCSCPLLDYSDPTSGAPKDHDAIQEHFLPPRLDWVASFQDWDNDSIPNGAELYYIPELGYGILDPYCSSSDWDQYSDRLEWMSWQYKNLPDLPYPLDDPCPYVVRNGCHPLIPAYPQPSINNYKNELHLPFAPTISTARGMEGSEGMEAAISQEDGYKTGTEIDANTFESKGAYLKFGVATKIEGSTRWELTDSWEISEETDFDYANAYVWNHFMLKNTGTEPFDRNYEGEDYFSARVDITWPGDPTRIYAPNETIEDMDGLVPFGYGEGYGSGFTDSIDVIVKHQLREMIGLGDASDVVDTTFDYDDMYDDYRDATIGLSVGLAIPGWGMTATVITMATEYQRGLNQAEEFSTDLYEGFIDDFDKSIATHLRSAPIYNFGDGTFSCDNLCDWTSVEAAHRSYVTIICVYPEESDYANIIKESPIKPNPTATDSFYTLKEFIAKYASGAEGPPKIEKFTWSTTSDDVETLIQVGCLPNVARDSVWIPPAGSTCDTIRCFGDWVCISSIDTVTEPFRKDDLPHYPEHPDSFYLGGATIIRPGDVFIYNYLRDSDNDTLEDNMELIFGTNPYKADSDEDVLYDGAEIKLGLDPLNPNSDHSYYEADDGPEMAWLSNTDTLRLPVETFEGDTIYPPRTSWDTTLAHSPRLTSGHKDFVPWIYNDGSYNSKNDDQYMDANLNGLADWVEHYFRDPNSYWNGRFRITWDGEETRINPFGYKDNITEARGIKRDSSANHLSDTLTLACGNRVFDLICTDVTGEGAGAWDNSYIYVKIFNCDIDVNKYLELSYDIWPRTANGKHICPVFLFSDGTKSSIDTTFRDSNGARMHPALRPSSISVDTFTRVNASLEPFDGKEIIAILVGYEDNPNDEHGQVHAYLDNLTITNKNLVLEFEPDQAPEEGFNVNEMASISEGFRAWGDSAGMPLCSLAMLSSPDPHDTTDIPIDTMKYGPRGMVYEVNGYADPMMVDSSHFGYYDLKFSMLPEDLEYTIEPWTVFGYYIWHDHLPNLYHERDDLPDLVPPKVLIDFEIYHPQTGETAYMIDYLHEEGEDLQDQWGNSYYPWERNEIDSDSDLKYRPVSGDFWRYIDVEVPDILVGWRIQDIIIRYNSDLPLMGNIRSYIDNVAIFQRRNEVYADTFGVYVHFGDMLADDVDNNVDTIVDWEELHIHKIAEGAMNTDFVEKTYASLLLSNDIGPWSYDVDTVTGDTSWHWYETDIATGDTSYSWFAQWAMNADSAFKLANTWLSYEDSLTTIIDVDSFPTTDFNDDDSLHNFGFMSNVPGDSADIDDPILLCQRLILGDEGFLYVHSYRGGFMYPEYDDSTKLFDVRQLNPCSLCTKRCLFMVYEAWVEYGGLFMGYKLQGADEIVWFDEITSPISTEYREAVPDTFSLADSSDIVESVWIKAQPGTRAFIDNFMLRRAFYASFEPNDPPTFIPDDLKMTENVTADTCDIFEPEIDWPTPTEGEHYLYLNGEVNGFSPARFRYDIWELPPFEELELTQESKLTFHIYYHLDFPATFGNAIIDLRLISFDDTDTTWLSEYFLPDEQGEIYHPQMRVDPLDRWLIVRVPLGGLPEMRKVDRIAVYFNKPSVVSPGEYHIFIDEILISL